jgi:uncharacterized protein GlcG (DUF336 family)
MKTKHYLTSADVEILVDAALQYATVHSFNVSIAVVDDGGTLLMMKRMDGASVLSTEICQEKHILLRSAEEQLRHRKI